MTTNKQYRNIIDTHRHFRREGRNVPEEEIVTDLFELARQERDQKREQQTQTRVTEIANKYGFRVKFNGDPRGGAIRFILPSGASNNWDNETWGIYW